MKRSSTSPAGALHPIIFFLCIYGISLFLAIFVCRTVYYSINDDIKDTSGPVEEYKPHNLNATAFIK